MRNWKPKLTLFELILAAVVAILILLMGFQSLKKYQRAVLERQQQTQKP
jgi:positive regulator of sigma E activity